MKRPETFGQCLQRVLAEAGMSASEAARLVQFRSRNSMFRILGGDTSSEVNARFLVQLKDAVGDKWPCEWWQELEEALCIEQLGVQQHASNAAFRRAMYGYDTAAGSKDGYMARPAGGDGFVPLREVLTELVREGRIEIVVAGCYEMGVMKLLAECCREGGESGRLRIRQYIDVSNDVAVRNILSIMPLIVKPWYNARLVDEDSCPEEMLAVYRVRSIYILKTDEPTRCHQLIRYDREHFVYTERMLGERPELELLDLWRNRLELLKPMPQQGMNGDAFVRYTSHCAQLESDCTIMSIKPDVHFNCIPVEYLESAITEGFLAAGIVEPGDDTQRLLGVLRQVHVARTDNMFGKHRPTHMVYSLSAMERFMQTGVLSDQFYIQRAYSVEERRGIMTHLYRQMLENPYFNIHFLNQELPSLCSELTMYDGKGVLLMDAYTGYALDDDHSEALITLPVFMDSFRSFFMDTLLKKHVMSRTETLAALEKLAGM